MICIRQAQVNSEQKLDKTLLFIVRMFLTHNMIWYGIQVHTK